MVRNRAQVNQAVLLGAHEQGCPSCLAINCHLAGLWPPGGPDPHRGQKRVHAEGAYPERNENLLACEVLREDVREALGVLKFGCRDLCFPVAPRFCILEKQYCLKDRQPFCWRLGYKNSSCTTRFKIRRASGLASMLTGKAGTGEGTGSPYHPHPHTWPHADFPCGCS